VIILPPLELLVVFVVALIAGAVAYVSGFGIGSLLTPLFALRMDLQLAVASVSIPHFIATLWRFLMLRNDLNKKVFLQFGLMSAVGGLAGALLHNVVSAPLLTLVFSCLLIFAGSAGVTGMSSRMRFGPKVPWLAGLISGVFGGLVGNQGGIRSAALLGFDLSKAQFVATATAIGIIVDTVRMPVYSASRSGDLLSHWSEILVAVAGVVLGTVCGRRLLANISESIFKRTISSLILVLGLAMLIVLPH
jgi:uncharacterized protein